jgi:hypothetical protein
VPDTVAENWSVAPVVDEDEFGVIVIEVTAAPPPPEGAFIGLAGCGTGLADFAEADVEPAHPGIQPKTAANTAPNNAHLQRRLALARIIMSSRALSLNGLFTANYADQLG